MKIQFDEQYGRFNPGWVIDCPDRDAQNLIDLGVAHQVPDNTRALKYNPAAQLSFECVTENNPDELVSKDASNPEFPKRKRSALILPE